MFSLLLTILIACVTSQPTITQLLLTDPNFMDEFSILNGILAATSAATLLNGTGPFTLIAPNNPGIINDLQVNNASEALQIPGIANITKNHVINGILRPQNLTIGQQLITICNEILIVTNINFSTPTGTPSITLQDPSGRIIETIEFVDIDEVSNGVIYGLPGVLNFTAPATTGLTTTTAATTTSDVTTTSDAGITTTDAITTTTKPPKKTPKPTLKKLTPKPTIKKIPPTLKPTIKKRNGNGDDDDDSNSKDSNDSDDYLRAINAANSAKEVKKKRNNIIITSVTIFSILLICLIMFVIKKKNLKTQIKNEKDLAEIGNTSIEHNSSIQVGETKTNV